MSERHLPLVSVVVPIYNSGKYLRECLDSLINQTYMNLKIVLVDDGSTDDSFSICKRYASYDKRIIVFRQRHKGTSSARNAALKIIKNGLIMFVDSDDVIRPDCVKNAAMAILDGAELGIFGYRIKRPLLSRKVIAKYVPRDYKDLCDAMICKRGIKGYCCNKIYRAEIVSDNNIMFNEDLDLIEDMHFNIQYAKHVKKIIIVRTASYVYRQRKNSAIRRSSLKSVKNAIEAMRKITPGNKEFLDYILLFSEIQRGNRLNREYNKIYKRYLNNAYIPISQKMKIMLKRRLSLIYKTCEILKK